MPLIVQRIEIENKTWGSLFRSSLVKLCFRSHELAVYPAEPINIVLDVPRRVKFQISKGGCAVVKTLHLKVGQNNIEFDTSIFAGTAYTFFAESVWAYLDEDISVPGRYLGRPYSFNSYTCGTAFDDAADSLSARFPSFITVQLGRCYYVDTDNKIVTLTHPTVKEAKIKEKLKDIFKAHKRTPFAEVVHFTIDRENALGSGALVIMKNIRKITEATLAFSFNNEIGEDYGAVRREFFYLALQEILADSRLSRTDGIYDVSGDSPCSEFPYDLRSEDFRYDAIEDIVENYGTVESSEVFFTFLGILFGCVLHFGDTMSARFSLAFYEALLNGAYSIRHLQDVAFQRSALRCIREEMQEFEDQSVYRAVIEKLYTCKANAYAYVRAGFQSIISADLRMYEFTAFDFPFIFLMFETLTADCIRKHVTYEGCDPHTREVVWLWEILAKKDTAYLRRFLQFFTGSGNLERFDEQCVFWFVYLPKSASPFFRASSCAKRLEFGAYPSAEKMEYYMDYSILNTEGFHKV